MCHTGLLGEQLELGLPLDPTTQRQEPGSPIDDAEFSRPQLERG
jgi:hypothetical protein